MARWMAQRKRETGFLTGTGGISEDAVSGGMVVLGSADMKRRDGPYRVRDNAHASDEMQRVVARAVN